jgi:hypothetical protein
LEAEKRKKKQRTEEKQKHQNRIGTRKHPQNRNTDGKLIENKKVIRREKKLAKNLN